MLPGFISESRFAFFVIRDQNELICQLLIELLKEIEKGFFVGRLIKGQSIKLFLREN